MRQIASVKAGQLAARYGEHAPTATVCCNACRTCVQTNLIGLALGAATAAALGTKRRLTRRP
jgi:hypothetical protein